VKSQSALPSNAQTVHVPLRRNAEATDNDDYRDCWARTDNALIDDLGGGKDKGHGKNKNQGKN